MKLYCVRHGQPLQPTATAPDPGLAPEGERDVTMVGEYLAKRGMSVGYLYSSYKQRAQQTAAIMQSILGTESVDVTPMLDPAKSIDPLVESIADWHDDTMLVGHMPCISQLVSQLVGGDQSLQLVKFTPGTVVSLERGDGCNWVLNWIMRADLLVDQR